MGPSEEIVAAYLHSRGLRAEQFTKAAMRQSRTPDFRVFLGDELVLFCEVKNAQEDRWLDEQGEGVPPGVIYGGARPDPIYNRIANYVHNAAGQFQAVNPDGPLPNVLAIVNEDRTARFADLQSVLTGNFYTNDGAPEPMFRYIAEGRIREDRFRIGLYLWFEPDRSKPRMIFSQANPEHDEALCRYFGVRAEQIRQLARTPR